MLNDSKLSPFLRKGLWAKAANFAMLLQNNLITMDKCNSSFQHFLVLEREKGMFELLCKNLMKCQSLQMMTVRLG